VVYVHGWLNDERQSDGNYVEFKKLIERLRNEQRNGDRVIAQQVVGIYLTWQARSDIPVYQYLTFWDRMHAADRISQSAIVTSTIGAINHALDQTPHANGKSGSNQVVLIGHSFGARILYAATSQSMLYAVQQARPRTSSGQYKLVRGIADTVILLNPAVEATMFASIDDVRRSGASFRPEQRPLLVTIATSNDHATRYVFPVGQWLAQRTSSGEMTTLGNFSKYFTHSLRRVHKQEACDTQLNQEPLTKGFFAATRSDAQTGPGLCLNRMEPGTKEKITSANDPFLVVETTREVIDNHSGIWASEFFDWLFAFVHEFASRGHGERRSGE
jgi:pimeloyl-ACP methyl ester carboxylesterase